MSVRSRHLTGGAPRRYGAKELFCQTEEPEAPGKLLGEETELEALRTASVRAGLSFSEGEAAKLKSAVQLEEDAGRTGGQASVYPEELHLLPSFLPLESCGAAQNGSR